MIRNPEKTGVFSSKAERQQYIDELVEAIVPFAKDNLYSGGDIVRMLRVLTWGDIISSILTLRGRPGFDVGFENLVARRDRVCIS